MNEPSKYDSSGEIEPNPEVIFADENEEPSRKRARATGSSEGSFEKLIAAVVEKTLKEKKIEESIRDIQKATLEISDSVVKEVSQLKEKILKMETETFELKQKMGQQEEQMKKSQIEYLQIELENVQKRTLLLEFIVGMMKKSLKMETESLEMKSKIEKLQEDSRQKDIEIQQLKEKLQNSENSVNKLMENYQKMENESKELKSNNLASEEKRKNSEQLNVKSKEKLEEMEKGSTQVKTRSTQIESEQTQPRARSGIIASDDCELPLTAAEQEYLNKCIFCKSEEHKSMECKNVPTGLERRRAMFSEQKRCLKCLELLNYPTIRRAGAMSKHLLSLKSHSCPRVNVICSNCHWGKGISFPGDFHHPILCYLNDQGADVQARRQRNNELRQSYGLPPRFVF